MAFDLNGVPLETLIQPRGFAPKPQVPEFNRYVE